MMELHPGALWSPLFALQPRGLWGVLLRRIVSLRSGCLMDFHPYLVVLQEGGAFFHCQTLSRL